MQLARALATGAMLTGSLFLGIWLCVLYQKLTYFLIMEIWYRAAMTSNQIFKTRYRVIDGSFTERLVFLFSILNTILTVPLTVALIIS